MINFFNKPDDCYVNFDDTKSKFEVKKKRGKKKYSINNLMKKYKK